MTLLPMRRTRGRRSDAVLEFAPTRRRRPSSISSVASSAFSLMWKGSGLSSRCEEIAREIDRGSQIPSFDMGIVRPCMTCHDQS